MISLRTVREEEITQLSRLAHEIWHECFISIISYEQIEYMASLFLSPEAISENIRHGYIYRVLKDEEKMFGFTASVKEDGRIFLSKLYLLKDYRGKGYGRMLVEDVISLYDEDEIYLTVNKYNPAYDLYLHLGFEVTDSVVTDIGGGFVMDDYIMSKKINRQS